MHRMGMHEPGRCEKESQPPTATVPHTGRLRIESGRTRQLMRGSYHIERLFPTQSGCGSVWEGPVAALRLSLVASFVVPDEVRSTAVDERGRAQIRTGKRQSYQLRSSGIKGAEGVGGLNLWNDPTVYRMASRKVFCAKLNRGWVAGPSWPKPVGHFMGNSCGNR